MSKRSFTLENAEVSLEKFVNSRFESKEPRAAAVKATRRLFSEFPNKKEIKFTLRETTQGSAGRHYTYYGLRQKLGEPKVVSIAGQQITYEYEYKVRSCGLNAHSK